MLSLTLVLFILLGAETHLGGGDMSAFVFPLASITRALASAVVDSIALREVYRSF